MQLQRLYILISCVQIVYTIDRHIHKRIESFLCVRSFHHVFVFREFLDCATYHSFIHSLIYLFIRSCMRECFCVCVCVLFSLFCMNCIITTISNVCGDSTPLNVYPSCCFLFCFVFNTFFQIEIVRVSLVPSLFLSLEFVESAPK